MANDEHIALLQQGTAAWNEWRERNPDKRPELRAASFFEASLEQANLGDAHLFQANLIQARLGGAHLGRADLRGADLSGANLRGANLFEAKLGGADLGGAYLANANLGGAYLLETNLSAACLREADFRGAYLLGANLLGADLHGANFSGATFAETIFGAVDLTGTNGLNECRHDGPSVIDFRTPSLSENLPTSFLRGCGLPDDLIDYLPSLRGSANQFYSCFISYSTKDQVFADGLHADLQNKGVRCWFAPHDMPTGAKIWDAIDEAIRLRDRLLLILSKASIASEWVEDEVNKAYAEERSRKEIILFPIRIDNTVISTNEPWAVKLRDQRNIGDFRQWKKPAEYQKSLERLLRDLRASV